MIFLLLAILSTAMVSIVMRLSGGKATNNFAMLLVNYAMCTLLSAADAGFSGLFDPSDPQLAIATAMGCFNGVLYLTSFLLLQVNVKRNGVVLSSTFMKLGLLVTMAVSVCVYGEVPGLLPGLGFLMAVAAIVLMNYRKQEGQSFRAGLLWLLLCGGMADAMSKIFEESGVPGMEGQFLFFTFATALALCATSLLVKKQRLGKWEVVYGLLIGIPNFYSTKFLLGALEQLSAVLVFPAYSVGGILVVTITGVLAFGERLTRRQWLALGLILAALVLLNM